MYVDFVTESIKDGMFSNQRPSDAYRKLCEIPCQLVPEKGSIQDKEVTVMGSWFHIKVKGKVVPLLNMP
jgi:hypothetical protein